MYKWSVHFFLVKILFLIFRFKEEQIIYIHTHIYIYIGYITFSQKNIFFYFVCMFRVKSKKKTQKNNTLLLRIHLCSVFQIFPHRDVGMWGCAWMSHFRGAWSSLTFDKEYLFGFEVTSGILSMHEQLGTLQRERKTWNHIVWPL